ncbi:MAG: hypothetical protein QXD77_01625 [Candidatus Aenigmatarchaeota archaeon]
MADDVDWRSIGLTDQQAGIMRAVLAVRSKGLRSSPAELQRAYEKASGQPIQKPNFFAQLKVLLDRSFLLKQGGEYFANLPALEKALDGRSQALETEAEKLRMQSKNFKKLVDAAALQPSAPLVQYQSLENYFGQLADQLDDAELFCSNSVFPWVCFSIIIASVSGSMEYYNKIRALCGRKDVEVRYISAFNAEHLARLALRATHGDKRMALQECLKSLSNLRSMLKIFPNLHIRCIPGALNFHFVVLKPRDSEPRSLYLFIFGEPGDIQNGVIINSPRMAQDVQGMFEDEFRKALDMRSPKAEAVYKRLEREFRALLKP